MSCEVHVDDVGIGTEDLHALDLGQLGELQVEHVAALRSGGRAFGRGSRARDLDCVAREAVAIDHVVDRVALPSAEDGGEDPATRPMRRPVCAAFAPSMLPSRAASSTAPMMVGSVADGRRSGLGGGACREHEGCEGGYGEEAFHGRSPIRERWTARSSIATPLPSRRRAHGAHLSSCIRGR